MSSALVSASQSEAAAEPWTKYSDADRRFYLAILFLVTTCSVFDFSMLAVVLEPIKQEFQVSDTALGLLTGFAFSLMFALAGIPVARWADRGNRRTLLSIAVAGWSMMAGACGLAQSFWQLVVARAGLGLFQPGALPTAQSLITDYFPPQKRGMAFGILSSGLSLGYLAGVGAAGWLASAYGWRTAFVAPALAGLAIALLARLFLSEPRLTLQSTVRRAPEPLHASARALARKKSLLFIFLASLCYLTFSFALNGFLPSFLIRSLKVDLANIGATWGPVMAGGTLLGSVLGGWLANFGNARDLRWLTRINAMAMAVGGIFYCAALLAQDLVHFICWEFIAETAFAVTQPVSLCAIHAVCGGQRRALTIATMMLLSNLVAGGLGPLLAGALSDFYAQAGNAESLRYSLLSLLALLAPGVALALTAGRWLREEVEA